MQKHALFMCWKYFPVWSIQFGPDLLLNKICCICIECMDLHSKHWVNCPWNDPLLKCLNLRSKGTFHTERIFAFDCVSVAFLFTVVLTVVTHLKKMQMLKLKEKRVFRTCILTFYYLTFHVFKHKNVFSENCLLIQLIPQIQSYQISVWFVREMFNVWNS